MTLSKVENRKLKDDPIYSKKYIYILHHYIINHVKYSYNVILKEIHKLNDYH